MAHLPRHLYVTIEGSVGSGKSTLAQHLTENLRDSFRIIPIPEDLEYWDHSSREGTPGLFTQSFLERKDNGFSFQNLVFASYLRNDQNLWKQVREMDPDGKPILILQERSIRTALNVFVPMMNLDAWEEQLLLKVGNQVELRITRPDLALYMNTDEVECHHSYIQRGRAGEDYSWEDFILLGIKTRNSILEYKNNGIEVVEVSRTTSLDLYKEMLMTRFRIKYPDEDYNQSEEEMDQDLNPQPSNLEDLD